jgi:hypothetical protein
MRWLIFLVACAHVDPHQIYLSGRAHYRTGQYQQAIAEFDQAYKISHEPALLFDISLAYRKMYLCAVSSSSSSSQPVVAAAAKKNRRASAARQWARRSSPR